MSFVIALLFGTGLALVTRALGAPTWGVIVAYFAGMAWGHALYTERNS